MKIEKLRNLFRNKNIFNKDLENDIMNLFETETQKLRNTIDQYSEELDAQDKVIDQAKVISKLGLHRRAGILNADEFELIILERLLKELPPQPMNIKSIYEALLQGKKLSNKLFSISIGDTNTNNINLELINKMFKDPNEWSVTDD